MNVADFVPTNKTEEIADLALQLQQFVDQAAASGTSLYDTEKGILAIVLKMGHLGVDRFLHRQGDGDLGGTIETAEGVELHRSEATIERPLRTIFGEHTIESYVYVPGPKQKIALRPIDARVNLPAGRYSYLLEEFSQYFCVEQAFGQAADSFHTVLGQKLSVDTLERTNQRLGEQAREYLNALPEPPKDEEGELLVATADGKGVPLIREVVQAPAVHGRKASRPGNRRMATLACVYSVNRYARSAEDVMAALFRDEHEKGKAPRPQPCHKRMTACFSTQDDVDTDDPTTIRGDLHAWAWAAGQIDQRRVKGQPLIRLCDGQESLWRTADQCRDDQDEAPVDILDIIHVSGYVWMIGRALYGPSESSVEHFVRDRLLRILQGDVRGVIRGARRMATEHGLRGQKLADVTKACNYFEKNMERMRYDEYLAAGYPIASGVIEGACRHLVKDRMERSGMRWREPSAGRMLFVRALQITDQWNQFQKHRQAAEQDRVHPNRQLLGHYAPNAAIAL